MNSADRIGRYQVQILPVAPEDGGGFQATFPQLGRTVVGYGATREESLRDLRESVPALIESLSEHGDELPTPEPEPSWQNSSGRVTLRLPKLLHAQLNRLAAREGVSLNALLATILQSAATALAAGMEFGCASQDSQIKRAG